MYEDELKRVEKKLLKIIGKHTFDGKKIVMFGVSDNTRQMIRILRKYQYETVNILDNDKQKQNSFCAGVKVISVESLRHADYDSYMYLIYSGYWREMYAQLKKRGVKDSHIFVMSQKPKSLMRHFCAAGKGRLLYRRYIRKFGELPVFVCPYTGTGDIYLIGTFWNAYLKKNHIEHYIFLVISGACKKVALLCGIENVEVLPKKKDVYYLLCYYMLCPEQTNIKVLNDSWAQIHTNPVEWLRGYKGLGFTKLFRRYVFDLPDSVRLEHPVLKNVENMVSTLFEEKQLKAGNTVILSPYANTLADLPDAFWKKLVGELKAMGYIVCTNCNGESEPAIQGTIPVFFSLDVAPQFVEKAGFFIGIRSGLCDVISNANAKKVILYDAQNRFYNSSAFEYFSLKKMELCEDVTEIEYVSSEFDKVIDQILCIFAEQQGV